MAVGGIDTVADCRDVIPFTDHGCADPQASDRAVLPCKAEGILFQIQGIGIAEFFIILFVYEGTGQEIAAIGVGKLNLRGFAQGFQHIFVVIDVGSTLAVFFCTGHGIHHGGIDIGWNHKSAGYCFPVFHPVEDLEIPGSLYIVPGLAGRKTGAIFRKAAAIGRNIAAAIFNAAVCAFIAVSAAGQLSGGEEGGISFCDPGVFLAVFCEGDDIFDIGQMHIFFRERIVVIVFAFVADMHDIVIGAVQRSVLYFVRIGDEPVVTGSVEEEEEEDQQDDRHGCQDLQRSAEQSPEIQVVNDLHDAGGDHSKKEYPHQNDKDCIPHGSEEESDHKSHDHGHGDPHDSPHRTKHHRDSGLFVFPHAVAQPGQGKMQSGDSGQQQGHFQIIGSRIEVPDDRVQEIDAGQPVGGSAVSRQVLAAVSAQYCFENGTVQDHYQEGKPGDDHVSGQHGSQDPQAVH